MSKDNKYYTPEVQELGVGFEFEEKNEDGDWIKETYPFGDPWFSVDEIYNGRIRVKYLDREDIESLGWEPGWKMGLNEDSFTYKDNQLYWQDNQWIQIYNWDSKIIFEGLTRP